MSPRAGRVRKVSPPPGFDPRIVQPVASHCTDYAIVAHKNVIISIIVLILRNQNFCDISSLRNRRNVGDSARGWMTVVRFPVQ